MIGRLSMTRPRWTSRIVSALALLAPFGRTRPVHYLMAAVMVGMALALRLLMAPQNAWLQYVTFLPAVTLVAVFGGPGPAMAAAVASFCLADYLFFPPVNAFHFSGHALLSGMSFLADCAVVCGAVGAMQHYYRRYMSTADLLARAKSNEEQTRLFFERQLVGMAITSAQKGWIRVNDRLCQMLGYSRDELKRLTWAQVTHPDDLAHSQIMFERLANGEVDAYAVEKRYIHKDGSVVHAELSIGCVRRPDGSLDYALALLIDVTERKRAQAEIRTLNQTLEQRVLERTAELRATETRLREILAERSKVEDALQQREIKFHTLFDSVMDCIAILDLNLCIKDINRVGHERLGYTKEEMLGKRMHEFNAPESTSKISGRLAMLREKGHATFEAVHRRKDGSVMPVEINARIVELNGQQSVLSIVRDNTAHKMQEAALRGAIEAADRATAAKSRFLAATSHDLRQPLQALTLQVGLLAHKSGAGNASLLEKMERCLYSMNEILSDLLDLSKFDAGAVTPNISDFSVAEVMASVAAIHALGAAEKNLRLHLVASALTVRTDRMLLERVLVNLLSNAIRYTQKGGVLIGCRRRAGKVWIEIHDTGIGIPADKIDVIFEEFRQLDNAERNREKGTGLGLAIVKRTADLLGLEIRVSSRPGRGSSFAIELPLGVPADAVPPSHPAADHEGRKLRVAVVDDDVALRQTLVHVLEAIGHDVVDAATTPALLAGLGKIPPDILIADYRLGNEETGVDSINAVKAAFCAPIPAIVLTGDTDPDRVREITAHGVKVRHKPLKLEALTECLHDIAMG